MRRVAVALTLIASSCSNAQSRTATIASSDAATVAPTNAITTPTTQPVVTTSSAPSTARIEQPLDAPAVVAELTGVEQAAATGDGTVGVRQQLLYRYLSAHPDMDAAVLAGVPASVRTAVQRIIEAREFSQAKAAANPTPTAPSDTLPAWTIVAPLTTDELLTEYRSAEQATGIAWYWLAAIHLQETRMGRIVGVSSAGAVGPMQFLPSTWAECCTGDPTNAHDAILGAATYLAQSGGPSDMQTALHTYNPNDTYVRTVTAFAENMRDQPELFAAYREWQVFYTTSAGTVRLPVGYSASQPIDAATYLRDHPQDRAG